MKLSCVQTILSFHASLQKKEMTKGIKYIAACGKLIGKKLIVIE